MTQVSLHKMWMRVSMLKDQLGRNQAENIIKTNGISLKRAIMKIKGMSIIKRKFFAKKMLIRKLYGIEQ